MMADNRGMTLVELIIVVAIIAVLSVALGFQYVGWQGRYRVESEVKGLYSDMLAARVRAMQVNRAHQVVIANQRYRVSWDTSGTGIFTPAPGWASSGTPIAYAPSWASSVTFDSRGMVSEPQTTWTTVLSIWFTTQGIDADYDCVAIQQTRIGLGKWTTVCNVK